MAAPSLKPEPRIQSIDILRGAVMVIMAIDHVRVYSGLPAGGASPGIFFTRWVTHFCAPVFVFFAGTSAYLYGKKLANVSALSRYLLARGLLLVVLELTLIRFTWTFNFDYSRFVLAGVIWMLGWCMVLLAPLVRLPTTVIGALGLAIILMQQFFARVPGLLPESLRAAIGPYWEFIYPAGAEPAGGINVLYVLVPWIGVMAAGYAFGSLLSHDPARRGLLCVRIGLAATTLFLIAGSYSVFTAQARPGALPPLLRLLNQQKYPPSPLFLLMTLGPALALMPLAERARGWFSAALAVFGRVPMFYYLLHIPAIHVAALLVTFLREGALRPQWYATAPYTRMPPDHRWSLFVLYLVWLIVVAILYFACRWFAEVKARHRESWLRYL
jgi:uncharacterized membrane protein